MREVDVSRSQTYDAVRPASGRGVPTSTRRRAGAVRHRFVAAIGALSLLMGLACALPAGATAASTSSRAQANPYARTGPVALATGYIVQFYPLWFTHAQYSVAGFNQLIGPNRISPIYQGVVAINDDTLYASSPIDVSAGPLILTVPATPAGYSVLNLDPYGRVFPSGISSKASGVTTPTTVYGLVAPGYKRKLPAGVKRIELPLDVTTLIFRVDKYAPDGTNQIADATAFRAALKLQPLRGYRRNPDGGPANILPEIYFGVPFKTVADTLIRFNAIRFLRMLQTAVHSSFTPPLTPAERALSDVFDARFGNGGSALTPLRRLAFIAGARAAYDAIQRSYLNHRGPNNWIHFTNIGNWGTQVLDRAAITEFCQYCNGISTAAYYHVFRDGHGAPLNGKASGGYVLTFPRNGQPDASRFWSLTAYTPNAIELIPNSANKYLVARYTPGLRKNKDGSLSIYISTTRPKGVPVANWLPVSNRPFNLMLRVYGVVAGSSVADNSYVPPPVVKLLTTTASGR